MMDMKKLLVVLLSVAQLLSCDRKIGELNISLSYAKSSDVLNFEVKIISSGEREISLYRDLKQNVILGVLPLKVKGRHEYILTERRGEVEKITLTPSTPHIIYFSGKIEKSNGDRKIDFGELGFVELGSNDKIDLGVVIFPAELSIFDSDDGYASNYIEIDLGS